MPCRPIDPIYRLVTSGKFWIGIGVGIVAVYLLQRMDVLPVWGP